MKAKPDAQPPSMLDECRRCDLWRNATQPLGGQGVRHAKLMLVGEQPGDQAFALIAVSTDNACYCDMQADSAIILANLIAD